MSNSTQQQKKTPCLRFPEFSGEFQKTKIGSVVNISSDKYRSKKTDESFKDIEMDSIESETGRLLKTYDSQEYKSTKTHFSKDDVLYGKLRPYLKKFYQPDFDGVCSTEIWVLKADGVLNDFLYNFVQTGRFDQYVNVTSGTKMPRANWEYVSCSPIYLPTKKEQKKIADFLSSLDKWIENLQVRKQKIEDYKRGLMQKLFCAKDESEPALRFPQFSGEWEEVKLDELLEYEQPGDYRVENDNYDPENATPVLTAGKTFILGYTDEDDGIKKDLPVIIFDDFTTANKFVDFPFKVKSSAMKILSNKNENKSDIRFVYGAMQRIRFDRGEAHKRFWIRVYSQIKIRVPSIEEQKKIADFLSKIDTLIAKKGEEIEAAKKWKRGLMQKMFV
jgi:type I restriction enzyme S subunit